MIPWHGVNIGSTSNMGIFIFKRIEERDKMGPHYVFCTYSNDLFYNVQYRSMFCSNKVKLSE